MMKTFLIAPLLALSVIGIPVCAPWVGSTDKGDTADLKLPNGFKIEVFADDLKDVRSLCLGDDGTVFAGSFKAGNVYALKDENNDGKADKRWTIAEDLWIPNGVAFRGGDLYIAEVNRILKLVDIESKLDDPPSYQVVYDLYPDKTHHGWKYIAFGPDEKLYVPVGAPCNICESEEEVFASITRMDPDGSNMEVYAHGIRNTVGFTWKPGTNDIWFTDNGRDWMGDNMPPDELNRATQKGQHFGYPYCHGGEHADPKFGEKRSCDEFESPVQNLHPHGAALGLTFYTGDMFPEQYKKCLFICEHGSWNRSDPIGYQISVVGLNGNKAINFLPFCTGFLKDGDAWGRPVDILQLPDGSLIFSDDHGDRIWRISYSE